ncbi:MAG: SDR family oxidoreductase [Spirulina sp. SIO3F2]|nr:SDR family oxidoreductase [Spirulina sp. SIO3F2]
MSVSLVIGGTRGIGKTIVQQLRQRGDQVYTASRRQLKDEDHIQFDIASDALQTLISKIDHSLNYLVFTQRYRGESWDKEFHISLKGVDRLVNALKTHFAQEASVVILGSNASQFIVREQTAAYHASRAALESLTKYYAVLCGRDKVRFNCVLPCTLIKPENVNFFTEDNKARNMIEEITPLGRMGTSQDVANLVCFLCSEKSSFITGQSLMLDGGLSLRSQESIARELLNLHSSTCEVKPNGT